MKEMRKKLQTSDAMKLSDRKLLTNIKKNRVLTDCLKNSTRKPNGRRYSTSTKKFATTAYLSGPAAYRHLVKSKVLVLPGKRSIINYNSNVRQKPGTNTSLLDRLESKTRHFSKKERVVLLAIDGMAIRAELTYNAKTDTFHGFPDDGIKRRVEKNNPDILATEAISIVMSSVSTLDSSRWENGEPRFKMVCN